MRQWVYPEWLGIHQSCNVIVNVAKVSLQWITVGLATMCEPPTLFLFCKTGAIFEFPAKRGKPIDFKKQTNEPFLFYRFTRRIFDLPARSHANGVWPMPAAKKAMIETVASRLVLPFPVFGFPAIVMAMPSVARLLQRRPVWNLPLSFGTIVAGFAIGLPAAIAMAPQTGVPRSCDGCLQTR